MTSPISDIDPADIALFLDFDGTLVPIASRPDMVRLEAATRSMLERLHRRLAGAIAIVTGRDLHDVDAYLAPLVLPAAAVHGAIRRRLDGSIVTWGVDDGAFERINARLSSLAQGDPRLVVEGKRGAVALHYRGAPEQAGACAQAMIAAAEGEENIELLSGNMVLEARRTGVHKGHAIRAFMGEPPFLGRRPVFVGDDVTDEDGFRAVNAMGGVSVKIGTGDTEATVRVADIATFLRRLGRWTEGEDDPV